MDASVLRPTQSGSKWTYWGKTLSYSPGYTATNSSAPYLSITTQLGTSTTSVTETSNHGENGTTDESTVSVSNGAVVSSQKLDFTGNGRTEQINMVELRSPVRQNDMYVILDKRLTDTAYDVDGDGVMDAMDVAIYAQVIGAETLTLPSPPTLLLMGSGNALANVTLPPLSTIRVDTIILTRLAGSRTGQLTATKQSKIQTWYAPGVGIVRQTSDVPVGDVSRSLTEESLIFWAGNSDGFGVNAPRKLSVPTSSPVVPGMSFRSGVEPSVFAFDNHALLVTPTPSDLGTRAGIAISRCDSMGQITSIQTYPNIDANAYGRLLVKLTDGIALLDMDSAAGSGKLFMTRFDIEGGLVGKPAKVSFDLGGGHFISGTPHIAAAADGAIVWFAWSRHYIAANASGTEQLLRAFDLSGNPLTPEIFVPGEFSGEGARRLTVNNGRAMVTWLEPTGIGHALKYAVVTVANPALSPMTLAAGLAQPSAPVQPLLTSVGAAFLWDVELGTLSNSLPSTAGIRLDNAYQPVRSTSGNLNTELIPSLASVTNSAPPDVQQQRVVLSSSGYGKGGTFVTVVSWLTVGEAPLRTTPATSIRFEWGPGWPASYVPAQAVFKDRIILFGGNPWLESRIVWLKGNPV